MIIRIIIICYIKILEIPILIYKNIKKQYKTIKNQFNVIKDIKIINKRTRILIKT
jgi:hypothetical protein